MLNGTSASSRLMSRGDVQCMSPVASYRGAGMSIPETHSLPNFNNVRFSRWEYIGMLFFVFLKESRCFGSYKGSSQGDGSFEHPQHMTV